jgi:hypothetical protein
MQMIDVEVFGTILDRKLNTRELWTNMVRFFAPTKGRVLCAPRGAFFAHTGDPL